jgi:hypothetical protein
MPIRSDYIEYVPATPEDVLAIERDAHRHEYTFNPVGEPDVALSFDSTVEEWRYAWNLLPWRKLGRALNQLWEIDYSDEEWQAVLEPAEKKTLGDVCGFIAATAQVPCLKPARIAVTECRAAGVFLAVRDLLAAAGANVEEIAPSTPIADYARRFASTFLYVSRFAPGMLPTIRIRDSGLRDFTLFAMLGSWFLAVVGLSFYAVVVPNGLRAIGAVVAGLSLFFLFYALDWALVLLRIATPKEVRFGDVVTFRDLAVRLSEHAP